MRSRKKKEPIGRETETITVQNDSLRATKRVREWELYYEFDDVDDALYSLYKYGMKIRNLEGVI